MDVIPPAPPIPIPTNFPLAQDDYGQLNAMFDPLVSITAIRDQIRGERPESLRDMASQWWEFASQVNVKIATGTERTFSWLEGWQSKGQDVLLQRVETAVGHMRDVASAAFDISIELRVLANTMDQGQTDMEERYREYTTTKSWFMTLEHDEKRRWLEEVWLWDVYFDREPEGNWDSRFTVMLDLAFEDYWNRQAQELRDEIAADYMESYRRLDPWTRSNDVQHHSGISGQRIPSWQPLDYVYHMSADGLPTPDFGGIGAPPAPGLPAGAPPPLTPLTSPPIPAMPAPPVAPAAPPPLVGVPPGLAAPVPGPPGAVITPPPVTSPTAPTAPSLPGAIPVPGVPPALMPPTGTQTGAPPGAVVDNPAGLLPPGGLDVSAPPGSTITGPGTPAGPGTSPGGGPGFRMPPGMGMPPGMRAPGMRAPGAGTPPGMRQGMRPPGMGAPPGRQQQRRRQDGRPPGPGGLAPPTGEATGWDVPPGSGAGIPPGSGLPMPPGRGMPGAPPMRPGQQQRRQGGAPPGGTSLPGPGVPEAFLPPAGAGPPVLGSPRQRQRDRPGSAAEAPHTSSAHGAGIGGGTPPVLSNQHHTGPRPTYTQRREQERQARQERLARLRERLKSALADRMPESTAPVLDGRLATPGTPLPAGEVPPALQGARQPVPADPHARPVAPADRTVRRPVKDTPGTPEQDAWEVETPGGPVVARQPVPPRPDPAPRQLGGSG